ncbi:lipopolysaccharide assembly protein LapB [Nocardiopsis sp. CNT312]|uniref:tetratricopeptide repeat protein n=1 Tax=Nocardiopsis sp. CNT312 TaxID=1137268 RepID=UPI0004AF4DE1|nr:tetratricopeptide repeat protein [Nocardiopsis sp. CNT312]
MTTTAGREAADLCAQARDLAENGHLERAAELFSSAVAADPPVEVLAGALLGLAVVRDRLGDLAAARDAARRAMDTGDPRSAPRAAHHLALSLEQDGRVEEAADVWRRLLDLGGPAQVVAAHHALARLAEARGDSARAREHWERALAPLAGAGEPGPPHAAAVAEAARDLTGRLLEQGAAETAAAAADRGLRAAPDDPELRVLRAATRMEQAVTDLVGALDAQPVRPDTFGTAVELLAGLLALRGEPDAAAGVWSEGVRGGAPGCAEEVRGRLRRGFAPWEDDGETDGDGGDPWWEPYLEEAVATSSAPLLAGELFAALTRMYALLAVPVAEGEARPAVLRQVMEQALRVPDATVWGEGVHADARGRMGRAAGGADVLPPGRPGRGGPDTP